MSRTIYVYPVGEKAPPAAHRFAADCRLLAQTYGFAPVESPAEADLAIAPLLTRKIGLEEWAAPKLGTLIFHPSALPVHRGPDAIRQTLAARERVSAASWFWCDGGLDTGPICEQEVVVLDPDEKARDAYEHRFIPAALRALARSFSGVLAGAVRRVQQDHRLSTYESFLPRTDHAPRAA